MLGKSQLGWTARPWNAEVNVSICGMCSTDYDVNRLQIVVADYDLSRITGSGTGSDTAALCRGNASPAADSDLAWRCQPRSSGAGGCVV